MPEQRDEDLGRIEDKLESLIPNGVSIQNETEVWRFVAKCIMSNLGEPLAMVTQWRPSEVLEAVRKALWDRTSQRMPERLAALRDKVQRGLREELQAQLDELEKTT